MDTRPKPSVGFVGWNPFQFLHFSRLISEFPGATLVLEDRRRAKSAFDLENLPCSSASVLRLNKKAMRNLDSRFDILVCQTVFSGIEEIRDSKIAMLQYGYAKEAHNFAPWRAFGDLCLTFGPYATGKIEPFCHCVATGNPRYEDWDDPAFRSRARQRYTKELDPRKKTVLYAPTWGAISSFDAFADAVSSLADEFNVILKIHHITQREGNKTMDRIRRKFPHVADADDDIVALLAVADVMISDYSGAIFDSVYGRLPLVLLDTPGADNLEESTSDPHSIERSRRDELGQVVSQPQNLAGAIHTALQRGATTEVLRGELFVDASGATRRAAAAIRRLADGGFHQGQAQSYIRKEMRALFRSHQEFPTLRILKQRLRHLMGVAKPSS